MILIDASQGCERERGKGACEPKCIGTNEPVCICAWIEVDNYTERRCTWMWGKTEANVDHLQIIPFLVHRSLLL